MRQCKCGGIIRVHELVRIREAWTCGACGRYEIIHLQSPEASCQEQEPAQEEQEQVVMFE